MPLRNVPWKNTAKDMAEILRNPEQHFPTIPPFVVMSIKEESMSVDVCWTMLLAACSPECVRESIAPMLIKALGTVRPSVLTLLAIEGGCAQGPPQIAATPWTFMPPVFGSLSVRDRALTHLRWARDSFIRQGSLPPQVLPQGAAIYPDERQGAFRQW